MIFLDSTRKLEIKLDGTPSTQFPFVCSFSEIVNATMEVESNATVDGTTNSTSVVTLVDVASAGTKHRKVQSISIFNADTQSFTVTVQMDSSGTKRTIKKFLLGSDQFLTFDGDNWDVQSNNTYVSGLPVGTPYPWLTSTIPTDSLLLDGSTYSSATYPELYAVLGTTTLPDWRGRSPFGGFGSTPSAWVANTTYALGKYVKATASYNYVYECTTAGTSHATTEPTWPTTVGATVTDGTVTWTCRTKLTTLGTLIGQERHLLTDLESGLPSHSHSCNENVAGGGGAPIFAISQNISGGTISTNSTSANASTPHENLHPGIVVNWCIKAKSTSGIVAMSGIQNPAICQGRLTLTSGTPVTISDVTGATTLYWTPYNGNQIGLYDGTRWVVFAQTELSLALGTLTASKNYDVWMNYNSGTPQLLLSAAWTNDTTRAEALALQDGIYVKSGTPQYRYLGTIRTTSTTTTADAGGSLSTSTYRNVWNYYNRVPRPIQWYYNGMATIGSGWTLITASTTEFVIGVVEDSVYMSTLCNNIIGNNSGADVAGVGIGLNGSNPTYIVSMVAVASGTGNIANTSAASSYTPRLGLNTAQFGGYGSNYSHGMYLPGIAGTLMA